MDSRRPDLNLLLAFEALLVERSVTRAASRLALSQPVLSAQLARLRVMFADELFLPTFRGVVPTPRALELAEPLRDTLEGVRRLVGSDEAFEPATTRFTASFGGSDYMHVAVLLPFLLDLRMRAPGVCARVLLSDSRTAAAELEKGEIDLSFLQPERVDGGMRSRQLFSEDYVGIARKGSVGGERVGMERFLAAEHVNYSPRAEGTRGATDTALAALGLERRVCFAVSSFVFLVEAVARSDMLAMAPRRLALAHRDELDLFDPPVEVPGFSIAMQWHDRTNRHAAHAWLRDELAVFCRNPSVEA